jgi:hypothetical protein
MQRLRLCPEIEPQSTGGSADGVSRNWVAASEHSDPVVLKRDHVFTPGSKAGTKILERL